MRIEYKIPHANSYCIHDQEFYSKPKGFLSLLAGGCGIDGEIKLENRTLTTIKDAMSRNALSNLRRRREELANDLAEVEKIIAKSKEYADWYEQYRKVCQK